jgi:hypothetical protein
MGCNCKDTFCQRSRHQNKVSNLWATCFQVANTTQPQPADNQTTSLLQVSCHNSLAGSTATILWSRRTNKLKIREAHQCSASKVRGLLLPCLSNQTDLSWNRSNSRKKRWLSTAKTTMILSRHKDSGSSLRSISSELRNRWWSSLIAKNQSWWSKIRCNCHRMRSKSGRNSVHNGMFSSLKWRLRASVTSSKNLATDDQKSSDSTCFCSWCLTCPASTPTKEMSWPTYQVTCSFNSIKLTRCLCSMVTKGTACTWS